jgi:hypothetical protein
MEMPRLLMISHLGKVCVVTILVLFVISPSVQAAINTIAPGNTVFLGEENLNIAEAMDGDTQIGWWASAAAIPTTAPSYTITVASPTAFFISPTDFAGKLGPWYCLNTSGYVNGTAFTVSDPNIDLRVMDATLGVDATENGWITTGSEASFKITTNLYQMGQRAGVSGAPVTIKVQAPDGAVYSALVNKNGATTNIVDMPVPTSPYSTGAIWDTGRSDLYPYGTYRIWAECNANSMKDNYGDVGKTYTASWGLLDQERNPLIGANTRTFIPTTVVTTSPTTEKTTIVTTVKTTAVTTTPEPTTPPTTETVAQTTVPATIPPTKSPGFEFIPAGVALVLALLTSYRKE